MRLCAQASARGLSGGFDMNLDLLQGWVPLRMIWRNAQPSLDWGFIGENRFTESFFEQTVARCLRHPANLLFRHETSMEVLEELLAAKPGLAPTGFIFHMSRCGSTLVAQMLAALESTLVISEARPIDQVLRANFQNPAVDDVVKVRWLRGMINALGQPRTGLERHFFVKFDSWHVLQLPLLVKAFPHVPWIFLYRDPVEVMVSQARQRGAQMIPGTVELEYFGLNMAENSSLDEFCARVLGRVCEAAVEHHECGHGRLVHFRELTGAMTSWLPKFFGMKCNDAEIAQMHNAAQFNAKTPALTYEDDSAAKQREATDEIKEFAQRWIAAPYEKLEQLRADQTSATLK